MLGSFLRLVSPAQSDTFAGQLAHKLVENGNFREAESAYQLALSSHPDAVPLVLGLADVLARCERIDEATSCFLWALELDPMSAVALNGLGVCAGDVASAEDAFRQAVELAPDNVAYRTNLAVVLLEQDRRSEAVAEYLEALRLDSKDVVAAKGFAEVLIEDGHFEEAVGPLLTALRGRDPAPITDGQAWMMYELRAFEQADKIFYRAHKGDSYAADAYYRLGRAYLGCGRGKSAVKAMRAAVSLAPTRTTYHRALAEAFIAAGEVFHADAARERARQLSRKREQSGARLASWVNDNVGRKLRPLQQ